MKTKTFYERVDAFKDEVINTLKDAFEEKGYCPPSIMMHVYNEKRPNEMEVKVMSGFGEMMQIREAMPLIGEAIREEIAKRKPIVVAFASTAFALKIAKEDFDMENNRLKDGRELHELTPDRCFVITIETHCMEYNARFLIEGTEEKPKLVLQDEPYWTDKLDKHGDMQNFLQECYVDLETEKADLS